MKAYFRRRFAALLDLGMCGLMNGIQCRHRLNDDSSAALASYVERCAPVACKDFYAVPTGSMEPEINGTALNWQSPVSSGFPANDRVHANLFSPSGNWGAPTVIILHALMSANDVGYRRIAQRLNELGWNACFVHLPFHYSRRPPRRFNGELAITADLVRTAETLRQGVIELRQVMGWFRGRGCSEFGLLATSYGAWIAALLSFVETDFRFIALMTPIVNLQHAVWESWASVRMRAELNRYGIVPEMVQRHAHLSSPLSHLPLAGGHKALVVAGSLDRIARVADVEELHRRWPGSHYAVVEQGHFGYRILPATMRLLMRRGLLARV